jgi:hypothetical protein
MIDEVGKTIGGETMEGETIEGETIVTETGAGIDHDLGDIELRTQMCEYVALCRNGPADSHFQGFTLFPERYGSTHSR